VTSYSAVAAYMGSIIMANYVTAKYGFVPVGFGLTATAGTYFAGAALLLRDVVQDAAGRRTVMAAIIAGGLLSALLTTPRLAVASAGAFLLSESADMAVYSPLRRRGWARAVLVSNIIGAVTDTVVFLWLANFPVASALPGQFVGKVFWVTIVPVVVVLIVIRVHAISRDRFDSAGA